MSISSAAVGVQLLQYQQIDLYNKPDVINEINHLVHFFLFLELYT